MKKTYLILATAIVAFASCSDNTYMGDPDFGGNTGNGGAISFGSSTPSLTRAVGATAAEELGYSFAVYATKTVSSTTSNVFAQNSYSASSNTPYWVWYNSSTANTTTSNTADWEYVGAAGNKTIPNSGTFNLSTAQDIKYWDYSATQYDFVAYKAKPVSSTPASVSNLTTTGFTVSGTAEQLGNLYIADKKTITSGDYGKEVEFTFRNAAAKVRLGIYETIPGYDVKNVTFRPNGSEFTASTSNAILTGTFIGDGSTATESYNVTFGTPSTFARTGSATPATYYDFGTFTSTDKIGETSIAPTWAGATSSPYYNFVLPNPSNTGNMILYVNYDLVNTKSGETIHVYGAKAVVPAIYMVWKSNYAYTYLFKISDNTNGATSETGGTPEGLFPITFDAVTETSIAGNQGIITTVSTPAITTYQNGSVSEAGITYANANGAIYITVNTNGTLADLTASNTKLYTVPTGTTEADLILGVKTKTSSDLLSILAANEESQGITFALGKAAKFTPANNTTYAIEYQVSAAVTAVYTAVGNGTTLTSGNKYYTSNTGTGEFTSDGTEVADGTNYFTLTTPASPAVYQYKVIVVGNPS